MRETEQTKEGQERCSIASSRKKQYEQWVSFQFSFFQWPSTLFNSVQDIDMNLLCYTSFQGKKRKKTKQACLSLHVHDSLSDYRWHFSAG